MFSLEKSRGPLSVQQLNSELEHAQLELLSAHCAVHQLRLHYSTSDLVRFGHRDVLRKSAEAASALNQFYTDVEKSMPPPEPAAPAQEPSPEQLHQAVVWLAAYLRQQREHYLPVTEALRPQHKIMLGTYFSAGLLERVRVVELKGARVPAPDFFSQVRALGFEPPEISHMDSLTFGEVVVFNQQLTLRALFHALVHSVQIEVLGFDRYAELWVDSFVQNQTHFTVPLEVHAFSMASRFLNPLAEGFSVEEQVLRWRDDGRY